MSKLNILVSGIGGDIGQSVARCLKENGHRLMGCDMNEMPYSKVFVDKFYRIPAASQRRGYLRSIYNIIIQERIAFFVPVSEPEIEALNGCRSAWKNWPVDVLINNPRIINIFMDKLSTVKQLDRMGIRTPRTYCLQDFRYGVLEFPFVIKSRRGSGSARNLVVKDKEDLRYLRRKNDGSLIVQEYLGSELKEYTTAVFRDGRKTSTISFRRKLAPGGFSKEVVLEDTGQLHALGLAVAHEFDLRGCLNIQTRKVQDGFIPFEINPRISSTVYFRKVFGFDDVQWWMNACREQSHIYKINRHYRCGCRILNEIFWR